MKNDTQKIASGESSRATSCGPYPAPDCSTPYGFCPLCHAPGVSRERRPNGNDRCGKGHVYPSRNAIMDLTRALIRQCDGCKKTTAIDMDVTTDNKREMELIGQTVREVPRDEALELWKKAGRCECKSNKE